MKMTAQDISRILVALDSSTVSQSILRTAATLAVNLDVQLDALFIEDIELFRLAQLPFAREIVAGPVTARKFTVADAERSVLMQTQRLRQLVAALAQQHQVQIAFDVQRGDIFQVVCDAARQADLLVIGKNSQFREQGRKIGAITQRVLTSAHCSVMVLQQGALIARPVVVTYDGSETSQAAVLLATRLARQGHHTLIVVFPAVSDHRYQQLYQQLLNNLADAKLQIQAVRLADNPVTQLLQVIRQYHGHVLLLATSVSFLTVEQMQALILQADIPVILLR